MSATPEAVHCWLDLPGDIAFAAMGEWHVHRVSSHGGTAVAATAASLPQRGHGGL